MRKTSILKADFSSQTDLSMFTLCSHLCSNYHRNKDIFPALNVRGHFLPHVSFSITNTSNTESSLLEDNFPLILSHNEAWKVFKACVHYFSLFLKEQYVSSLFRTKYFEIKFNLQLLYLPIVSRTFILS